MRKPYRLAGGIIALVVGLLAFGSLHGWAEEEPPYPVERKGDPVTKNEKIDILDEEIVEPEHLVIAGGNITITSRTFEPKEMNKGWRFKSFGTTHVDIHEDDPPDGLSRYVVPPTADNDTATRIKVEAAGLVSDAAEWPLRCEGNLQPPPGPPGPPGTIPHWSAKIGGEPEKNPCIYFILDENAAMGFGHAAAIICDGKRCFYYSYGPVPKYGPTGLLTASFATLWPMPWHMPRLAAMELTRIRTNYTGSSRSRRPTMQRPQQPHTRVRNII
jgi:hypothetical protein